MATTIGSNNGYDLSNISKAVSVSCDLLKDDFLAKFKNDIEGQVVYTEKGNDIVVKAYGLQQVTYQKVVTNISAQPEAEGKNKGKYANVVSIYNATYDGNGNVSGWEANPVSQKTTYLAKAGSGVDEIKYQVLNSKNKVISTLDNNVEGSNKTIIDEKNVLVNLTFKNGMTTNKKVALATDNNFNSENLINEVFSAIKSSKSYKGTWLMEETSSTSDNETFALGLNKDTINYDLSKRHGNDVVTLVKNTDLTLKFQNEGGAKKAYFKKGNDVVINLQTEDYIGADYTKVVVTAAKNSPGWVDVSTDVYLWDEGQHAYVINPDMHRWQDYTDADFSAYQQNLGVAIAIGENMFFVKNYGQDNETWYEANSSIGTVSLKNYFTLAQDSTTIGDESLKTILERTEGVGILDNKDAQKGVKIAGTFLNEKMTGGIFADTLTTGAGSDTIYLSAGKDTVTIDGNGQKTFEFSVMENFGGETTVKFAKGLSYDQTKLNLSATAGVDGMGYVKSGNDLIVDFSATNRVSNRIFGNNYDVSNTSKVTVKDYFKDANVSANTFLDNNKTLAQLQEDDEDGDYDLMQIGAENKANKLNDTKYSDYLLGGKKADKFTISNGNAMVVLDEGKDTITVTKNAQGSLNLLQLKGSGADTLDLNIQTNLDTLFVDGMYSDYNGADAQPLSFEKTGDNLIMSATYNDGTIDSLTIKNYFDYDLDVETLFTYGYNPHTEGYLFGTLGEVIEAGDKYVKINGVKLGRGFMYEGTNFNDKYELNINSKSNFLVEDAYGDEIVTITSNIDNLRLMFDVYDNGNGYAVSDEMLFVMDKGSMNNKGITNCFIGENVMGGVGIGRHVEGSYTYYDSQDNIIQMDAWISKVKDQVANWLDTNGYESTYEVIESNDKGAITALVAQYNSVSYQNSLVG